MTSFMTKIKTRREEFESWGMKKHFTERDGQFSLKPTGVQFTWEFNPNYPPFLTEDYDKRNKQTGVEKFNSAIAYFEEFAGGPVDDIYFSATSSYYDSYDPQVSVYHRRMETQEEFEARKHAAAAEIQKRKDAAEKAKVTKELNERKQLEALLKKYGKPNA